MNYRGDIDGLRTVAVLPVVFYHADVFGFTGGFVGVDIFFVISGFLITTIIHRELAEGHFSLIRFYERRARRILPALFAVVAVSLVLGWFILGPREFDQMGESILSALLFVSNVWFWMNSGNYFGVATDYLPMLHTWSLAVEEQFYIFFPLLLMSLHRLMRPWLVPAILLLVLMSLGLAIWSSPRTPSAAFYLLPTRIWELGMGSLLALGLVRTEAPRVLREAAGLLGLVAVLAPIFLYDNRISFPGLAALPPVLGAVALIWAGTAGPVMASRFLSVRPMVWIGLISYSLYLWHWPIMSFVRNRLFTVELEPIWQVATIFASLVMSWLSWRIIERPFRVSLNHGGVDQHSIFALSGASLVLLISLAGFVTMTGGMATARFSDAQLAALPPEQLRNPHRDRCFGARPPERFCTFGTQDADAPIEWFVWGDSHADAMLPAFITLAERRGVRLSFAGQSACGPLPGLRRSDLRTRRNDTCSGHNRNVVEFLRRTPSITSVFLVGRWPIYTDGQYSPSADGVGDVILYAEDDLTLGNVEYGRNAILMESALERAVTGIAAPKRRVVLIGATPEIKWDVPRRRAAEILFGWPLPPAPTSHEVNERQAASSAILERVASKTGSFYIPMAQPMCAKGCTLFTESEMYYADDDHLSAVGAITLALPRLEAGLAGFIESGDEVWR